MEQDPLYELWDIRTQFQSQTPQARSALLPTYFCPTRRQPAIGKVGGADTVTGGLGDYAACSGDWGNATTGGQGDTATSGPPSGVFMVADVIDPDPNSNDNPSGAPVILWRSRVGVHDVLDGTSNTFLAGEKNVRTDEMGIGRSTTSGQIEGDGSIYTGHNDCRHAMRVAGPTRPLVRFIDELPRTNNLRGLLFGSYHPSICQFVMADGAVRPIRVNISSTTLGRLANRKDGEAVMLD
jgi:hypothetical protein